MNNYSEVKIILRDVKVCSRVPGLATTKSRAGMTTRRAIAAGSVTTRESRGVNGHTTQCNIPVRSLAASIAVRLRAMKRRSVPSYGSMRLRSGKSVLYRHL